MYVAAFQLDSFEHLPEMAQCALISTLVTGLAGVNKAFLSNRRVPRLYQSGVRYSNPPSGGSQGQRWRDVPLLLQSGEGTCHELCAWRAAEMVLYEAVPYVEPYVTCRWMQDRRGNQGLVFHVALKDDQGHIEDPSKALGMGQDEWAPFF